MSSKKTQDGQARPQVSDEMPVVPSRVLYVDIPIYNDPECRDRHDQGSIVILEPLDPNDTLHELDIMPTTLLYKIGELVHFRTNQHQMWDTAWFHNPVSGQVERAWRVGSAEFVGEVISAETVQAEQAHIEDLEKRLRERHPKASPAAASQRVN